MADSDLTEIRRIFQDRVPVIFRVMDSQGVLHLYWPLVRRCLVECKAITNEVVIHALMAVLATRCRNAYCLIMHSRFLMGLGFSEEEIYRLVRELAVPTRVEGHARWSKLIQYAFLAQHYPEKKQTLVRYMELIATPDEYDDIAHTCIAMRALNSYAEFYRDHVDCKHEGLEYTSDTQLTLEIPDLVSFHTQFHGPGEDDGNGESRPVAVICAECKRIKDGDGKWYAVEVALPRLEKETLFSHGICVPCYRGVTKRLAEGDRRQAVRRCS